jgi:uncharacterized protein
VIVVSDTTPISELVKVGRLSLLRDIFGELIIPNEVYDELTAGNHPAVEMIQSINWIKVCSVGNGNKVSDLHTATKLGWGECAAFILAEELGADRLLMDDRAARREAKNRNLPIIGTVGILLLAKQQRLLLNVKEVLDELIIQGARINPRLYKDVLALAGK